MKINLKKICFVFLFLACFGIISNTAQAYSTEAIRLYNQGVEDVKNENYTTAAEKFEKAIYIDPSIKDAYFNLGSVYKELGETQKAKNIITKLLRKDPFDDEATYLISKLYFDTDDYKKTIFYANTITNISPRYENAQNLIKIAEEKIAKQKEENNKIERNWDKLALDGFEGPAGITEDSKGNLYVANYKADVIQKLPYNKEEAEIIVIKEIKGPVGLAVDSKDNIYVAGYNTNNIAKISPNGETNIIIKDIKQPYYLFIKDDVLYISEQKNNSIIMINLWNLKK